MSPGVALWVTSGMTEMHLVELPNAVGSYTYPAASEFHHEKEVLERLSELKRMYPVKAWSAFKI